MTLDGHNLNLLSKMEAETQQLHEEQAIEALTQLLAEMEAAPFLPEHDTSDHQAYMAINAQLEKIIEKADMARALAVPSQVCSAYYKVFNAWMKKTNSKMK